MTTKNRNFYEYNGWFIFFDHEDGQNEIKHKLKIHDDELERMIGSLEIQLLNMRRKLEDKLDRYRAKNNHHIKGHLCEECKHENLKIEEKYKDIASLKRGESGWYKDKGAVGFKGTLYVTCDKCGLDRVYYHSQDLPAFIYRKYIGGKITNLTKDLP